MNVLEKILEEIGKESKLAHKEMRRCGSENPLQFDDAKGYARGIEHTKEIISSHMDVGKDTNVPSNDGWILCGERLPEDGAYQSTIGKIACDIVISALEKQIPKKPNRTTDGLEIRYTDSYRCPNCSKGFAGTGIAKFCYHCGQRLDWSDTD